MDKNMKFKSHKTFTRSLCVILAVVMLAVFSLTTFAADSANGKQYIKDVKLIYAASLDKAKTSVPSGYTLLEEDLNDGTGEKNKVYIAYSTTSNPAEAATDIKMMNMKGGFVLSDYEEQLKNVNENVKSLANDVKLAVEMFAANYVKGTYGAKAAYRALSVFTVDEAGGQNLADYFIYKKPGEDFYIKFVLNAHQNILSAVLSALAMAVQGEPGNTWLDRVSQLEDPDVTELPNYWDDSMILWEHFYGFYKVYKTIDHSLYDPQTGNNGSAGASMDSNAQPEIEYNGTEALYEVAYRTLKELSFGNGVKLSDWLLADKVYTPGLEINERFFCLLKALTPEELAMMRLCGPLYMILATGMDEESYMDYISQIDEATEDASTCSIWAGVNAELFRSSIGITDDAARAIAEAEFEKELNNDGDSIATTGLITAGLVAACGAVSLGVGLAAYYGFGALMLTCFSGTGLTAAASAVSIVGTIFGAAALTAGVAAVVIALVVAIVFLVIWIMEWYAENHPDYTDIPEFMYDYVQDGAGNSQFVLYEGVKFQDGRVADVNTWEGKEWHAMYVSHDKAAGAPIEADIIVRYGDGHIDNDYAGLSNFGHVNAQNLNGFAFKDKVEGIFVTYKQEDLDGDYARADYLLDAKLFSGEDADKVAIDLKNEGYVRYEVNLTPDSDYVTYLGYKTTNKAIDALTDIRLAYGYNANQYTTGGSSSSYGASGSAGDGSLTLYVTSISLFGSPIRSDFLILDSRSAPEGYEPVNLFSGGPAVNLNLGDKAYVDTNKKFYFYFLPSVTYTEGTEYLGGLTVGYDLHGKDTSGSLDSDSVKELHGYQVLHTGKGSEYSEGAILYTTTYNPYRAIYKVTALCSGGELGNVFPQNAYYDGVGHSIANRYIVTSKGRVRFEETEQREDDAFIYVAGIYSGGTPMKASDIYASASRYDAPDGMTPVAARFADRGRAANLGGGYKFSFYLFVSGKPVAEGNYITDLILSSKETVNGLSEGDVDCEALDSAYVMEHLATSGAHHAILKNLNLADSDNATYLGYSKRVKDPDSLTLIKPITNIILYYAGKTDTSPKTKMTFDGVSYELAGSANIFCKENGENSKCKRVYLYYTTNPAAGSPIIDIMIDNAAILNGWETVRTQNKKALYDDMGEYSGSMWFIHMKRMIGEPKYISEIVIGIGGNAADAKAELIAAGCDYMLDKDLNNNVGALSHYIYLGYKRTSDPNMAIRDLRTTHDNEVDSFVKNGSTYYKIEGNLNSYTHAFADDIFLYYTMDSKAGTPITSLGTSRYEANWTHGEGNRYVVRTVLDQHDKASDLNKNCGYQSDYIYLLQTRDAEDQKALASMIGNGSVAVVIAFALVSVGAIVAIYVVQKRRRVKMKKEGDE